VATKIAAIFIAHLQLRSREVEGLEEDATIPQAKDRRLGELRGWGALKNLRKDRRFRYMIKAEIAEPRKQRLTNLCPKRQNRDENKAEGDSAGMEVRNQK
jgi:hypothetical protein